MGFLICLTNETAHVRLGYKQGEETITYRVRQSQRSEATTIMIIRNQELVLITVPQRANPEVPTILPFDRPGLPALLVPHGKDVKDGNDLRLPPVLYYRFS